MLNYAGTCKDICSYNLVYYVLIQLLPLTSLVFVVHFLNAFWHGNETFSKGSSQHEIVPLFIVFHLPYSKYTDVRRCFYPCRYQNPNFSLMSHSCLSCSTRVAFMSFVQYSCRTCVALVLLVSLSYCICVTRVTLVSLVSGTRVVNQTRSYVRFFCITSKNQFRKKIKKYY